MKVWVQETWGSSNLSSFTTPDDPMGQLLPGECFELPPPIIIHVSHLA